MHWDHLTLGMICYEEGRADIAIDEYISALYYDTCCIHNIDYYNHDYPCINNVSPIILAFQLYSGPLNALKDYFFESLVQNLYNNPALPPSLLTYEEFLAMVYEMMNEIVFDGDKYNILLTERLREFVSIDYNAV